MRATLCAKAILLTKGHRAEVLKIIESCIRAFVLPQVVLIFTTPIYALMIRIVHIWTRRKY